jgi:iron(II)-dependent oxidoreductase
MDSSPYSVMDMANNALEWVADWYDEEYYKKAPNRNPKGPDSGEACVIRSGKAKILENTLELHCSNRDNYPPAAMDLNLGFRCAMDAK